MSDFFTGFLEMLGLLAQMIGWVFYGSKERPRGPWGRIVVRSVALFGVIVLTLLILGVLGLSLWAAGAVGFGFFAYIAVLAAEYTLGDRRIAYAAWGLLAAAVGGGLLAASLI